MSRTGVKQSPEPPEPQVFDPLTVDEREIEAARERQAEVLRLLWDHRRQLMRAAAVGFVLSTLIAFLIPTSYTSTAQLMPPDTQSSNGLAMLTALAGKSLGGLAGMTGELLGLKSSGALFVGVLRSETSQDRIVQQFDLRKVYGTKMTMDARRRLDDSTEITEDRKSGIITIRVTDHDAQRSAAIANAYVDQLNYLVAQLSTSAAHRERVFLEDRLKVAKQDLDDASNQLAQFSSKNNTLDIQIEGKAMLDAAGSLTGQLIFAESELEGLRQIYTDSNSRVRALNGRVIELRKQLEKLGGTPDNLPENHPYGAGPTPVVAGDPPPEKATGAPFPTIRNLPLLGAKYTDYYRRAKIQETVFELLTEQYELAKVQEAKETPSVKVLDPARVPERKSFPPRLLIAFVGTALALVATGIWLLGTRHWSGADAGDPRKVLALEVAATLRANAPWASRNGHASDSWYRKVWNTFRGQRPPSGGPSGS
jgi:capsule polysaccharide export protein KpsE/RkpR